MFRVKNVWMWNSDIGMVSGPLDHGNATCEGTTVLRVRAELKIYGCDCETSDQGMVSEIRNYIKGKCEVTGLLRERVELKMHGCGTPTEGWCQDH